jgi:hypothetical protein
LVKSATVGVVNDGPQKPSSIHLHVGQRPIVAAGNTEGDLAMLQWTAASPHRTLQLVVRHTDGEREYAYDRDPIWAAASSRTGPDAAERQTGIYRSDVLPARAKPISCRAHPEAGTRSHRPGA